MGYQYGSDVVAQLSRTQTHATAADGLHHRYVEVVLPRSGDVIHPLLWRGSGYETSGPVYHSNVAMDIAAMKRQITQVASDLQKLKASKMKMAMEIANMKQLPTTSTSTALLVECVPASTVPANSAPQDLQSVSEVMRANSKLCVPARASTLAVKLAREIPSLVRK
ncbi:hypothetical protein EMCRGX_G012162 [Ephydatia muelleri]